MRKIGLMTVALAAVVAVAAMAMPGSVHVRTSKFDGTTEVSMEPAWVPYSDIKLALFWNTKMGDTLKLRVVLRGAHSIGDGPSLHFNVDGQVTSFEPVDKMTKFETTPPAFVGSVTVPASNWSSRDYAIPLEFLESLLSAKKAVIKVDTDDGYFEGEVHRGGMGTFKKSAPRFLKKRTKALDPKAKPDRRF